MRKTLTTDYPLMVVMIKIAIMSIIIIILVLLLLLLPETELGLPNITEFYRHCNDHQNIDINFIVAVEAAIDRLKEVMATQGIYSHYTRGNVPPTTYVYAHGICKNLLARSDCPTCFASCGTQAALPMRLHSRGPNTSHRLLHKIREVLLRWIILILFK